MRIFLIGNTESLSNGVNPTGQKGKKDTAVRIFLSNKIKVYSVGKRAHGFGSSGYKKRGV